MAYLISLAVSVFGGWLALAVTLWIIRRSMGIKDCPMFRWLDFWLGATERSIATCLVIWAPGALAGFIGGWVALKFAANWQRRAVDERGTGPSKVGQASQIAIIGSALSFAIAIGCGLMASPASLSQWQPS